MKSPNLQVAVVVVCLIFAVAAQAQEVTKQNAIAASTASDARLAQSETIIPRLIKFSGTLLDAHEHPMVGPVGVTFALYAQQNGGTALWLESQNVKPDENGNYTVLLGANSANGVPAELFVSGEARWLGIQVGQQPEHERILLVSVPYALKAGDAETLGGLPASAFVTTGGASANTANAGSGAASSSAAVPTSSTTTAPKKATSTPQTTACTSVTSDGTATAGSISQFTTPCNVQGSLMKQTSINGFPGVNLAGNNAGLLLNGTGTHQVTVTSTTTGVSGRLGQDGNGFFFASDTNGKSVRFLTNNGTLNEWMRITSAGNVGIGTETPAQKLSVAGMIQSTTGGVMFPDATVQSSAAITQAAADARYGQLGATSNTFTGSITASSFSGNGAALTGLNASNLTSGLVPSPQLGGTYGNPMTFSNASNSFTGSGTGLTNLNASNLTSGTVPGGALAGTYGNVVAFSNAMNTFWGGQLLNPAVGVSLFIGTNSADNSTTSAGSVEITAGRAGGIPGGKGGNVDIIAGDGFGTGGTAGSVNILAGAGPGGGVNITAQTASAGRATLNITTPNPNGGNVVLTATGSLVLQPASTGVATVQTSSRIRMGSETTAEGPVVNDPFFPGVNDYFGMVLRRINSTATTAGSVVAKTDTMALVRDGTAAGFQISIASTTGHFSIACLGLTSTTTVVGFTDSFVNPSATVAQVFNQTDLQQFNCSFGNTDEGHMTEVNLLRHPTGSTWVGTVTSTFNQ